MTSQAVTLVVGGSSLTLQGLSSMIHLVMQKSSLPNNLLRQDQNRHSEHHYLNIPQVYSSSIRLYWELVDRTFPGSKRSILICCTYHPPSQPNFFDELLTMCDLALAVNNWIILTGDLNCNLLNYLTFEYQTSTFISPPANANRVSAHSNLNNQLFSQPARCHPYKHTWPFPSYVLPFPAASVIITLSSPAYLQEH